MGIKMNSKDNKIYVILGAPHTASSFIAKLLSENGVDMGRFGYVSGDPYYYEDIDFKDMNKKILSEAGGNLRYPPKKEDIDKVELDEEIKKLIDKKESKFWGWKDPRTTLTIEKYLPHLEEDVYLVCLFRKPKRIIDSYRGKSGFRRDFTKEVLDKYNSSILEAVRKFCEL